jgi:N-methylhydantoinase A/oxoprolinase/acetone carboxylase beta subunit
MTRRAALRVGIDVGGTFTDVVAVDAATRELIAAIKVPTTHHCANGVADGIVAAIQRLCADPNVDSGAIAFIAHSTTQATNALLEGDLARVGVLGLLSGPKWLAKRQMRFGGIRLESGASFAPEFAFAADDAAMRAGVDRLIAAGVGAVVASEGFGVDRPQRESAAVAYASDRGIAATSGHDVSSAYGLRARTRTAALNAAILPQMLRTARVTRDAVASAAIPAPLMVMRSDGGVMDVREIERRPILTLLSGPAAGIAGALLHERLSDGFFVEVGGTSSDCSLIRNGRPQLQSARIGGYRTMLRTLDVRTLGIGGGSMLRLHDRALSDVGPRSAHIAGAAYASFVTEEALEGARVERMAPTPQDPPDYAVLRTRDGRRIAPTLTCAANMLGLVEARSFACGDAAAARAAFELVAATTSMDATALARTAIDRAVAKVRRALERLARDYELHETPLTIVGGGGGSGAIVPPLAQAMGVPYRIARDAEVIAPIGVALALVRDVVERTIVAPTPREIARIRREAADRAIAAGAAPERVVVEVEIDTQRNKVYAAATGAAALIEGASVQRCEDERRAIAAQSLRCDPAELGCIALTGGLDGYERSGPAGGRLQRLRMVRELRVVDERGEIRVAARGHRVARATAGTLLPLLSEIIEGATRFGDVGRALPALYVLRGARVAVYAGLSNAQQAVALATEELEGCADDEPVVAIVVPPSLS